VPYQDDGQFVVYAGTGPDQLPELMPVLCAEIEKIRAPVTAEELKRAKAQVRAEILMGQESMMRRVNQNAKHLIHFGKILDLKEKMRKIEEVTVEDVAAAAETIFSSKPTLAALGPLSRLEQYDSLTERLAA
jgi:predicted Zn-dependent peptidase